MPLLPMTELLADAEKVGYALPAINFPCQEILFPSLAAARDLKAPIIMQMAAPEVYHFGENAVVHSVKRALDRYGVKAALHLDHGKEYAETMRCIRRGFTGVMFDGSALPYEENVAITREVARAGKATGVGVEGELGKVMGAEDASFETAVIDELTDPKVAAEFAAATGVDCLAVAIGSAHGFYKKAPKLDFDRLAAIRKATGNLPIVLHGGTGIPDEAIRKAVDLGIRKINLSTQVKADYIKAFRDFSNANPNEWNIRVVTEKAMAKVAETVGDFIKLLKCDGKA